MARTRQVYRQNRQYHTYGSTAYQPGYDGSAVRAPRRESESQPRPQVRPRRHVVQRPQPEIRQAGAFSPFAVIGFVAVAICAALLLIGNARLMVIKDQTVTLNAQLKTLQAEQASLLAQREQLYDLEAIEAQLTAAGTMVRPQPSQITYLNAAEPDSIVRFREPAQGIGGLLQQFRDFFHSLAS